MTPVRTSYDPSIHHNKNKGSSIFQIEYVNIIGSAMFLIKYTQPDIAYVIGRLSHYSHNPSKEH